MADTRKYTEAQKKSAKKWDAANLDRISIAVPKGKKATIQAHAEVHGESVNSFINRAITETMERDSGGTPSGSPQEAAETASGTGVVSLPSDALETVQSAAEGKRREEP